MADRTANDQIALIGLGKMGLPMARCLIAAGFDVRGFDISRAALDDLATAGGSPCLSVEEAVDGAAIVITMLPDGQSVRETILPGGNLLPSLDSGTLVIDMSSSEPTMTRALGEDLSAQGVHLIDAPVSGGVARAVSGDLTIMAGGRDEDIDVAGPIFEALGRTVYRTGSLGTGHAMKALNNYVSGAGMIAAMEALIVGRAFGLDPALMVDILNVSTGRNNTTEVKLKQFVLSEAYNSGFDLSLMAKDIGIAAGLADAMEARADLLRQTAQMWREANEESGDGADHTRMFEFLERLKSSGR